WLWVRKMSSIRRISSSCRTEVIAPPSTHSFPSMRKQVVRCLGSSPPWQPRTRSFMGFSSAPSWLGVPEPFLHLQELQILLHLGQIRHHDALGDHGDDAGLGDLVERLL